MSARDELKTVLVAQREAIASLLRRIENPRIDAVELIDLAESVQLLDARRAAVIETLREEASAVRKREEDRSTRQFVLRALDEIGTPQNARFLQEYVWATNRVDLDTRGFGALRRDERKSWGRRPGQRLAYVVPCLDAAGHPVARWMSRSDWPLDRRIVVGDAEELFDLAKVLTLIESLEQSKDDSEPFIALIEKYALGTLGLDVGEAPLRRGHDAWLKHVRRQARRRVDTLTDQTATAQAGAAAQLGGLATEQRFWGIDA